MVNIIEKISLDILYITPHSEDMLTTPSCINRSRNHFIRLMFQNNSNHLNVDLIRFPNHEKRTISENVEHYPCTAKL